MSEEPIVYKRTYNEGKDLPEPVWGVPMPNTQCPTCASIDMHASASPDDPTEIFGVETVRCFDCGHITDHFEAFKQRQNHSSDTPRNIVYDLP